MIQNTVPTVGATSIVSWYLLNPVQSNYDEFTNLAKPSKSPPTTTLPSTTTTIIENLLEFSNQSVEERPESVVRVGEGGEFIAE